VWALHSIMIMSGVILLAVNSIVILSGVFVWVLDSNIVIMCGVAYVGCGQHCDIELWCVCGLWTAL
jgi:hypothetical protein